MMNLDIYNTIPVIHDGDDIELLEELEDLEYYEEVDEDGNQIDW